MKSRTLFYLVSVAVILSDPCRAATLDPGGQGNLYLSRGQGYQPVNARVDANVGDQIMVSPGSVGMVTYPDGCQFAVQPGQVLTITSVSPCANPFLNEGANSGSNTAFALEVAGIVLGAAGIGVGVYAITNNKDNPCKAVVVQGIAVCSASP
ncbi:MAG TPA: hypothetical protein VH206_05945 [Xanthobacteraceae bacterium]|jgi:hypothetical protein|nr:hypothetical protein [Xanthobacteraceae bacterium]